MENWEYLAEKIKFLLGSGKTWLQAFARADEQKLKKSRIASFTAEPKKSVLQDQQNGLEYFQYGTQ